MFTRLFFIILFMFLNITAISFLLSFTYMNIKNQVPNVLYESVPFDSMIDSTKIDQNEQNEPLLTNPEPFPIQRIVIDYQGKLTAYNAFQHVSSTLIQESILISNLITDLNIKLLVVKRRKLILDKNVQLFGKK